jgi:hypothetical protein
VVGKAADSPASQERYAPFTVEVAAKDWRPNPLLALLDLGLTAAGAMIRLVSAPFNWIRKRGEKRKAEIERTAARMDEITELREDALRDGGLSDNELDALRREYDALEARRRKLLGIKSL